MIEKDSNAVKVFQKALELTDYITIQKAMLQQLVLSQAYTESQQYAIRICSEEIKATYHSPADACYVLNRVMNIKWQDAGLNENSLDTMTPEQRIGLVDGVVGVSKAIIQAKADELTALVGSDTTVSPTALDNGPVAGPTQQL